MPPVIIERRSLADAILTRHEQHRAWIDNGYSDDVVVFFRANPPDTHCVAALIAQLFFMEAQAHTLFRDENDFVVPIGKLGVDQIIAFFDLDGDDPPFAHVGVVGEVRFFDDSRACRENNVEIFVPRLINSVRAAP